MSKKTPQIVLEYPDDLPASFEQEITGDLVKSKINYHLDKKPLQRWAAVEWIIPAIISVYILKPYFKAFLSEAGKDHYNILRIWLRKLAMKTKPMKITTITSSEEKHDNSDTQSKAFSVFFQTRTNQRMKFMFDNNLDEKVWINSVDSMVELIYEHYDTFPEDRLTELMVESSLHDNRELYAVIDEKTHNWKFVDIKKAIQEKINRDRETKNDN